MAFILTAPAVAVIGGVVSTATEVVAASAPLLSALEVTAVSAAASGSTLGAYAAVALSGPVGWSLIVAGSTASEVVEPIIQPTGETLFGDSFEI